MRSTAIGEERQPSARTALIVILVLGLICRIAATAFLSHQSQVWPDADAFRAYGHQLWTTGSLGSPLYMPLYPALVGLTGPGWPQAAVDIALSTGLIWLVYELTLAIFFDTAAALLAALATAIYPQFVFFAGLGLTEPLFMVLFLAAYVAWYRGAFFPAAIFAVLSILTRPAIDLLAPLLVLYFALVIHRLPLTTTVKHVVVYGVVYGVLMTPWWIHNYRAYGTFVRLNLAAGENFYAGNNPMNTSGGGDKGIDLTTREFDSISDPVARDRAMWRAGVEYIRQDPKAFVEHAAIKFVRFWRLWPHFDEYSKPIYIAIYVLSYVPIFVMTLVYLILWGIPEFLLIAPMLAFAAYMTLVNVVFAASIRYRMPIEPFMIVLAATATVRLVRRWPAARAWLDRPWADGAPVAPHSSVRS
jgi:hypothetical protein